MTHGEIFHFGAGTAYQCRSGIDQATKVCRSGSESLGSPVRDLQTSGLPVCARSRGRWETGADSGSKDRLYRQATREPDPGNPSIYKVHGTKLKRDCNPGLGSFSKQGSQAWLSGANTSERFIWNTALIDCRAKRLPKPTNFWCPRGSGPRVIESNV